MQTQIAPTVRKFVVENFLFREETQALSETDSFLERGLIDSTGILELVDFLEQTFTIQVADDELLPENLDSISRISAYVQKKIAN
jgi:acyl carrier protein